MGETHTDDGRTDRRKLALQGFVGLEEIQTLAEGGEIEVQVKDTDGNEHNAYIEATE